MNHNNHNDNTADDSSNKKQKIEKDWNVEESLRKLPEEKYLLSLQLQSLEDDVLHRLFQKINTVYALMELETKRRRHFGHWNAAMLRALVHSGFLTEQDLGRFLLLVSKSFVQTLGTEWVWKQLCNTRWRRQDEQELIQRIIPNSQNNNSNSNSHNIYYGYRWLFHHIHKPQTLEDPQPRFVSTLENVLPLQVLSDENTVFCITIRKRNRDQDSDNTSNNILLTRMFHLHDFEEKLENPIPFSIRYKGEEQELKYFSRGTAPLMATLHCIRMDTKQCICLLQSEELKIETKDRYFEFGNDIGMGEDLDRRFPAVSDFWKRVDGLEGESQRDFFGGFTIQLFFQELPPKLQNGVLELGHLFEEVSICTRSSFDRALNTWNVECSPNQKGETAEMYHLLAESTAWMD